MIYQNGINKIPYTYHWDATLFDAYLGAAYRLGNRKLVPILQLGFSGSFFTGTDAGTDAIRGDGSSWTDFMFMKENICWGGYTGLIFEYPLKQHTLYANLSYQYNKTSTFKAQVISCRIGYKF